jgi:hypothetical protein
MKVQVWTKFSKNKLWKKLKSPLSVNFWRISTSKCRDKLQKWGCCTPILPKALAHLPNFQKFISFKLKNFKKMWTIPQVQVLTRGRRAIAGRWPALGRRPIGNQRSLFTGRRPRADRRPMVARWLRVDAWTCGTVPIFLEFFFLPTLHFLCKWSTLASWLQHMPTLPKLLLETSNTYNFWSVDPKNTIFFPHEAYCEMHVHKKFQKIQK